MDALVWHRGVKVCIAKAKHRFSAITVGRKPQCTEAQLV